jgi:cysteine-rich repeat protein
VCPVIILEHLDAASYRLEVSMSGQATGTPSVPYLVAAQTFGPTCGDGVVDTGEACDDGGRAVGDACSPTCTIPATHQYTAQERNAAFTEPPDSAADVHFLPYTASPASDDGYAFLELPVPFPFFGRTFHGLLLTTNGYLSFLPYADTSPNLNAPLGEVAPNALVTAVGTDLKLVATSRVRWWVEDDAQGKKRFIIDLKDLALKQDARPMVQARIELAADGEVVIAYGDLGLPNGTTFAAGLEGPEGIIRIPLPRCDALCDGGDVRGRRFILRPNAVSTGGM